MDSWFGKIREKLVIEKVAEEDIDSDEERRRKEEQMKDTLRKLNTDEVLNEDEIARASVLSVRKPIKDDTPISPDEGQASGAPEKDMGSVLQKTGEPSEVTPEKPTTGNIPDSDEPYGSQFWD